MTYSALSSYIDVCDVFRDGVASFNESYLYSHEFFCLPSSVSFESGMPSLDVLAVVCGMIGNIVFVYQPSYPGKVVPVSV